MNIKNKTLCTPRHVYLFLYPSAGFQSQTSFAVFSHGAKKCTKRNEIFRRQTIYCKLMTVQ